jgi:hypothetical protein
VREQEAAIDFRPGNSELRIMIGIRCRKLAPDRARWSLKMFQQRGQRDHFLDQCLYPGPAPRAVIGLRKTVQFVIRPSDEDRNGKEGFPKLGNQRSVRYVWLTPKFSCERFLT